MSSKLMTPYLGASVYVWAAVLSVTLLGLAIGYRLGDKLAQSTPYKFLWVNTFLAGVFILLSSYIGKALLPYTLHLEIRIASIIGGAALLLVPMVLMGTISPILVNLLNHKLNNISKATGIIYGLGTFSGIMFLLFSIYVLLPLIGLKMITCILGGLMIGVAIIVKLFIKHEQA